MYEQYTDRYQVTTGQNRIWLQESPKIRIFQKEGHSPVGQSMNVVSIPHPETSSESERTPNVSVA